MGNNTPLKIEGHTIAQEKKEIKAWINYSERIGAYVCEVDSIVINMHDIDQTLTPAQSIVSGLCCMVEDNDVGLCGRSYLRGLATNHYEYQFLDTTYASSNQMELYHLRANIRSKATHMME